MKGWQVVFNNYKNDMAFKSLPSFIQDCVRSYFCYDAIREVDHPYPVVTECHTRYTVEDVVYSYKWLLSNDIHSLIITESSTYLLELIRTLIEAADKCDLSVSIGKNYNKVYTDKWGDNKVLNGVVLSIRKLRSKQASRG